MKKLFIPFSILILPLFMLGCNSGSSAKNNAQAVPVSTKGNYVSQCQNSAILNGEKTFTLKVITDDTVEADGVICSGSLDAFNAMLVDYPSIKYMDIKVINGSIDDVTNLKLSEKVHSLGMVTRLSSTSVVASGGTDFFLAGNLRKIASGAKIGVHNWQDGDGKKGKYYPRSSPEHQKYLDYYSTVGVSASFYWFTLNAVANGTAEDGDMHWMTHSEINFFSLAL